MLIKVVCEVASGNGTWRQAVPLEIDLDREPERAHFTIALLKDRLWRALQKEERLKEQYTTVESLGDIQETTLDPALPRQQYADSALLNEVAQQNSANDPMALYFAKALGRAQLFRTPFVAFHIENIPSFWKEALKTEQASMEKRELAFAEKKDSTGITTVKR